jgi:hypothetical protein
MSTIDEPRSPLGLAARDVPVVPFPEGAEPRRLLRAARRPRILAVGPGEPPPAVTDDLEDWVRLPVEDDELALRQQTLLDRWLAGRGGLWLDEDGIVHSAGRWVALPPPQAAAVVPLVAALDAVVARADVREAYEAAVGPCTDVAFASMLARLRPKFRQVGGTLHLLSRGRLLLEARVHVREAETKHGRNNPMEL